MATANLIQIGFGGGCHWCTEAVFNALKGVSSVRQGFIKSVKPNERYSEAVELDFDARIISEEDLIELHLHTHASTSNHGMRDKYRSAIYVFNDAQFIRVSNTLLKLQAGFSKTLVTKVLHCVEFKPSLERYHHYYEKRLSETFCIRYIDPKIELIKARYATHLK